MGVENGSNRVNLFEQKLPTKAQQFFDEKIDVVPVSKEEFLEIVKLKNPDESDDEILQTKGVNFDLGDKTVILMRTDIFPEAYMPYMETHEKWEAYIARKGGYNLFNKSTREYKLDKNIGKLEGAALQQYYNDVSIYNYDFRHEYAVFKEYQQALADGKLEEYHNWIMSVRETEKQDANPTNLQLIENDTRIRNSIFKKLTTGTAHRFTRN